MTTPQPEQAIAICTIPPGFPDVGLDQMLESLRVQVEPCYPLRYLADAATLPRLAGRVPAERIVSLESAGAEIKADRLYLIGRPPSTLIVPDNVRVFSVELHGQITQSMGPADPRPASADAHVFGRLAPLDASVFFPYGYFYRSYRAGPVDAFGFRIEQDLKSFAGRPANHKVIACFGGSAAFSIYCLPHQTFCAVLEERLNRHCRENGIDMTFSVLNFGVFGSVLLNHIMHYVLFAQPLAPDIVLCHDGINDFHNGQATDPMLLDHDITYSVTHEDWSRILYDTRHLPTTQTEIPFKPINPLMRVLRAYIARKRQFHQMATAAGSRFVWGLQPLLHSKGAEHPYETHLKNTGMQESNRIVGDLYPGACALYDTYTTQFTPPSDALHVNFHEVFKARGRGDFFFWDNIHLTHFGDRFIGEVYAERIITHLIKDGTLA